MKNLEMKNISSKLLDDYFTKLAALYEDMDAGYDAACDHYGFVCRGCEDNCCMTRFYHHTCLEYFYLRSGYESLNPQVQEKISDKAFSLCRKMEQADMEKKTGLRVMCPLNSDNGLCMLYQYRPMICRMHGVAHELKRPDGRTVSGPGCDEFSLLEQNQPQYRFDRTPFYIKMAQIESELRKATGIQTRIKMTIAEMILHW